MDIPARCRRRLVTVGIQGGDGNSNGTVAFSTVPWGDFASNNIEAQDWSKSRSFRATALIAVSTSDPKYVQRAASFAAGEASFAAGLILKQPNHTISSICCCRRWVKMMDRWIVRSHTARRMGPVSQSVSLRLALACGNETRTNERTNSFHTRRNLLSPSVVTCEMRLTRH